MSAKLAYQQAPANLPDIPIEIWGSILRFATRVPDTLEDLSMERYMGSHLRSKRYQEALVTKRYVVRVCNAWNQLGTPFLYEHIQIRHLRDLNTTLEPLALPFTGRGSDIAPTFGHLTRRLDISLAGERSFDRDGRGISVLELFKLTPSLVIARMDYEAFRWIMSDFIWMRCRDGMDVFLPNLERIDLAEPFLAPVPPFASRYLTLMDCHPNLQRLDLMAARLTHDIPAFQLPHIAHTWPAVREIDFFPDELAVWDAIFPPGAFPNLEKAVALCHSRTVDNFAKCLQAHGRHLRSVLLVYNDSMTTRTHDRSLSMWYDPGVVLEIMKESCPALEELSFSATGAQIPSAQDDGRASAIIETVTTLGVEIGAKHFQFSKKICKGFLESALSWTDRRRLSNLRTIRFISEVNVLHMQRCHAKKLDSFLDKCDSAGVVVQDSFRTPLSSRRSQVTGAGTRSNSRENSALGGI